MLPFLNLVRPIQIRTGIDPLGGLPSALSRTGEGESYTALRPKGSRTNGILQGAALR
jgi:hypothetical protein